jgi:hypothetical protein
MEQVVATTDRSVVAETLAPPLLYLLVEHAGRPNERDTMTNHNIAEPLQPAVPIPWRRVGGLVTGAASVGVGAVTHQGALLLWILGAALVVFAVLVALPLIVALSTTLFAGAQRAARARAILLDVFAFVLAFRAATPPAGGASGAEGRHRAD